MNLAKLLVREGIVSDGQVKECLDSCKDSGQGVSESLVSLGYATENQIIEFLSGKYGVPAMDIDGCVADEYLLGLVPGETAFEKFLVPVSVEGPDLTVAVSDPSNILLLDDLGFITGKNIKPVVASERSIREKLAEYYGVLDSGSSPSGEEAFADFRPPGGPDIGSAQSSGTNIPAEDIMRELEQHEKGLTTSRHEESGAERIEEPQPVHLHNVVGIEQTNRDKNDFDLTHENITHSGFSHSDTEGGLDSAEPVGKETAGVNIRIEEENPEESAAQHSGGHTIGEEEKLENSPHVRDPNPPEPGEVIDGTAGTVLIVDVSPTVRKIMTMTLERAGYRVSAVGDGMQALARINEAIPDIVFAEIKLPHMDGYQLCKILKSHGLTKAVPVILVSGKTGVLDKMKVRMAGASDMITKPFQAGVLVETAEKFTVRGQLTQ